MRLSDSRSITALQQNSCFYLHQSVIAISERMMIGSALVTAISTRFCEKRLLWTSPDFRWLCSAFEV